MYMYLLDTDHITILQSESRPAIDRLQQRMRQYPAEHFAASVVSVHEQSLGAHEQVKRARNLKQLAFGYWRFSQLVNTYKKIEVLPFNLEAAIICDGFPAACKRVATMDRRIAATALAHGCTLLTRNVRDFQAFPDLRVEDWTR
jgi:tRNA(fMet)-specific endonuclease VapC